MMRIKGISSGGGAAHYYSKEDYVETSQSELSDRDDDTPIDAAINYYSQNDLGDGDTRPGKLTWSGKGAEALGLQGDVNPEELKAVLLGINPDGEGAPLSKLEGLVREEYEKQTSKQPDDDHKSDLDKSGSENVVHEANSGNLSPDQDLSPKTPTVDADTVSEGVSRSGDTDKPKWGELSLQERINLRDQYVEQHEFAHDKGREVLFTLDKSISLIATSKDGDARILDVIQNARQEAADYFEEHFSTYRVRTEDGREVRIGGNLIMATTMHLTNRAAMPHVHIHDLWANAVQDEEGKWHALRTDEMYQYQMLGGAIFQARVRDGLKGLGYDVEDGKGVNSVAIRGVTQETKDVFSGRGDEVKANIERLTQEKGSQLSQAEIQLAKAMGKPDKVKLDISEVNEAWRDLAAATGTDVKGLVAQAKERGQGRDFGDGTKNVDPGLIERGREIFAKMFGRFDPNKLDHALEVAKKDELARDVKTTIHDIIYKAMHISGNRNLLETITNHEWWDQQGFMRADKTRLQGITDTKTVTTEQRILNDVKDKAHGATSVPETDSLAAIERAHQIFAQQKGYNINLNDEQRAAVHTMLSSDARVIAIPGPGGTGKTTMMNIAKIAHAETYDSRTSPDGESPAGRSLFQIMREMKYKKDDHSIVGLAPSNKAVGELKEAGIDTKTLQGFFTRLTKSESNPHILEAMKAEYGGRTVVVDESSMLPNQSLDRLLHAQDKLGIDKLVLIGDKRQIAAMNAGAPFKMAIEESKELIQANLSVIIRQKNNPELLKSVQAFSEGKSFDAMKKLQPFVHETGTRSNDQEHREKIGEKVHELWLSTNKEAKIIVDTNQQRNIINGLVRGTLRSEGIISKDEVAHTVLIDQNRSEVQKQVARSYRKDDIIVFYRDQGKYQNGDTLRVEQVDVERNRLVVSDDKGKTSILFLSKLKSNENGLGLGVQREGKIGLSKGDEINFNSTKKESGLERAKDYQITQITDKQVSVREVIRSDKEETKYGKPIVISRDDPSMRHITYAYTMTADRAQGSTYTKVIAAASSKAVGDFMNHARVYVMASRAKDYLAFVTDNFKDLVRKVSEHDGMNDIALQILRDAETINPMEKDKKKKDPIESNIFMDPDTRGSLVKDKPLIPEKGLIEDGPKKPTKPTGKITPEYTHDGSHDIGDKNRQIEKPQPERGM